MDQKFLEFWGHFLINSAKSMNQADEFNAWIKKGFSGFSGTSDQSSSQCSEFAEIANLFRKLYGLDQFSENSSEYQDMAKEAGEKFKNSFTDYLSLMGFVHREEHLQLVQKYEKLKEKCTDQEETIRHLKMLLNVKNPMETEAMSNLQDIAKDQSRLFQKMFDGMGQYVNAVKSEIKSEDKPEAQTEATPQTDLEQSNEKKDGGRENNTKE
ncbi:hypothetical protein QUF76_04075 [Desulfobacterales bacterium HSG16]|nr:hypothetical protein [Desulfobacterales bacterium HSG16]